MAINQAGVPGLDDVLFNDVQEFLKNEAVFANIVMNVTGSMKIGQDSVALPKWSGMAVSDVLDNGTNAVDGTLALGTDVLSIDKYKKADNYIYDTARLGTGVDLDAGFLEVAPARLADQIEQDIIAEVIQASASAPDHILQMSGGSNDELTVNDIAIAAQLLDEAKVPADGRYLVVSPKQKRMILKDSSIRDASQAGGNSAIVRNEFANIMGFRMIVSNNMTADSAVAFHESHCAFGLQKQVGFEKERQASYSRDYLKVEAKYGCKVLDSGVRGVYFNTTGA